MLYPYTDNYLDDPTVPADQKHAFSARFRKRLLGETVLAANRQERMIFDLVSLIESDWERKRNPGVYASLLAIHDAQTRSIQLMEPEQKADSDALLSICVEKGGTSVLADGYLVNGTLTPQQEAFCFGFGVFLQYVDDIQDLVEDREGKLETFFTRACSLGSLDEWTNRTFSYMDTVLNELDCFPEENQWAMKGLMGKSIRFLLNEAIAKHPELWSEQYVSQWEAYSPFRYTYIRKRRGNMESNRISLMRKLEQYIYAEEANETVVV